MSKAKKRCSVSTENPNSNANSISIGHNSSNAGLTTLKSGVSMFQMLFVYHLHFYVFM